MEQGIINFAVYEDGSEYIGVASATLPDLNFITQSISGAGIAGNVEAVMVGQMDAMTLSLAFRTLSKNAVSLAEPRRHNIDLRIAQQNENSSKANLGVSKVKHVFVVVPKSTKGGSVAPASAADASGDYAVHYWAQYIDGKKVSEIDPLNFICIVNGVDYLSDVRSALGK